MQKGLPQVLALLPTPTGDDANNVTRDSGDFQSLAREANKLLPTPTSQASKHGSTPDENANGWGFNLWDVPHLLPTPTVQDGKNNTGPSQYERNSDPLNVAAAKMLPTPMANPENPGAGGELRAAIVHGEERRNETGVDTMGRPNLGRPSTGEPTRPPSAAGKNSRDQHPDQLTIGDA
jgi:hypothetical protein